MLKFKCCFYFIETFLMKVLSPFFLLSLSIFRNYSDSIFFRSLEIAKSIAFYSFMFDAHRAHIISKALDLSNLYSSNKASFIINIRASGNPWAMVKTAYPAFDNNNCHCIRTYSSRSNRIWIIGSRHIRLKPILLVALKIYKANEECPFTRQPREVLKRQRAAEEVEYEEEDWIEIQDVTNTDTSNQIVCRPNNIKN